MRFQRRLGTAGGFRDLHDDFCGSEDRVARRMIVVNSSQYVCGHTMLKPRVVIAGLSPYYSPIVSRVGLSLDLNESMAGCSLRVLARLRSLSAADVSLYPEREAGERLVADFLRIAPEQVLLTNGMDEALSLVFTA